jgi:tRNA-specific 2-thiouridylase
MDQGMDAMATGHYAQVERSRNETCLLRARDRSKDQSYFLCLLRQSQLKPVHFPLGRLYKKKVVELAQELGLAGLHAPASQDACFFSGRFGNGLESFLQERGLRAHQGDLVDERGQRLGRHPSLARLTIGQRHGLGVTAPHPLYVARLEPGRAVLAPRKRLQSKRIRLAHPCWNTSSPPALPWRCQAALRFRHQPVGAALQREQNGFVLYLDEPVFAPTPGQFAALYKGERLLGGARILSDPLDSAVSSPSPPS